MKIKLKALLLALAAALLIFTSGCGNDMAGRWRSESDSHTQISFSTLGKVVLSSSGIELSGTYTAEDGKLVMNLTAPDGEVYIIEATYEIVDKKLYLENSKGQIEVFTR